MPALNHWEASALEYNFRSDGTSTATASSLFTTSITPRDSVHDSIIYPGIYSSSGFDIMNILLRVMSRPNPTVELGAVDASVALILCDLQQRDCPVVYASDAFTELTGYAVSEVMGRNCRFLQAPGGKVRRSSVRKHVDKETIKKLRRAVERNEEISVEVPNFKKNGEKFINMLTLIPIFWDSREPAYCVGFMAEKTW